MRHATEPIQGVGMGTMGVIGLASFNASAASIGSPTYFGVIRQIRYISTGLFIADLFPRQLFYTVYAFASGDLVTNTSGYFTSNALVTDVSFQFEIAASAGGAVRNPQKVDVMVFGMEGMT